MTFLGTALGGCWEHDGVTHPLGAATAVEVHGVCHTGKEQELTKKNCLRFWCVMRNVLNVCRKIVMIMYDNRII